MPNFVTHSAGISAIVIRPVLTGTCGVIADAWDPEQVSNLLADEAVTVLAAPPAFLMELVAAAREHPERAKSLRYVITAGSTIPARLVTDVPEVLGPPLRTSWGMTESSGTFMGPDDPDDWGPAQRRAADRGQRSGHSRRPAVHPWRGRLPGHHQPGHRRSAGRGRS
ncbi:AMP-binding protein [Kibdelosporangium philippinense]|uniref:AMP-binding protein n=1 Tax=Kibdelosporangium philippinense TaxID=211113 RepID=UPI0035560C3B